MLRGVLLHLYQEISWPPRSHATWNTARDCSCDFMDGFAENFNNRQALLPEKKKSGSDGAPSTMEAAADT